MLPHLGLLALGLAASLTESETSTGAAGPSLESAAPAEPDADPLEHALYMSVLDGAWSILITGAFVLSARTLDLPQPQGLLGLLGVRVLYGTSWSLTVVAEIALLREITGPDFEGLSGAALRTDWIIGLAVPGPCRPGDSGAGCGLGLGSYSQLSTFVSRRPISVQIAASAGWLQGRWDDDSRRTVAESFWLECPLSVRALWPVRLGPVELSLLSGPGLYFGMHNAHLHPRTGADEIEAAAFEMVPLHLGAGFGLFASARLEFFGTFWLEAEAELAPLVVGASPDPGPELRRLLPVGRGDLPVWRRAFFSAGLALSALDPVQISIGWFMAELSARPLDQFGHQAILIRFEVPFVLDD